MQRLIEVIIQLDPQKGEYKKGCVEALLVLTEFILFLVIYSIWIFLLLSEHTVDRE